MDAKHVFGAEEIPRLVVENVRLASSANVLMGGYGGAEELSLYASLMYEVLAERIEQAGAVLADRFAKFESDEEWLDCLKSRDGSFWNGKAALQKILCRTVFLSSYSPFEYILLQRCKQLERNSGLAFGMKDFAGHGVERSKLYLSKVHAMSDLFQGSLWSKFTQFRKLRNVLVHNDGCLDGAQDADEVRRYCGQRADLDVVDNCVVLTKEFADYAIEQLRGFVNQLSKFQPTGV